MRSATEVEVPRFLQSLTDLVDNANRIAQEDGDSIMGEMVFPAANLAFVKATFRDGETKETIEISLFANGFHKERSMVKAVSKSGEELVFQNDARLLMGLFTMAGEA